ncbi:MAG: SpoIIE family protein phosphatase, partial [Firmicutes bacterium]|nr:SpoIIE family protein phosphatase [Bacillota bacterium]
DGMRYRPANLKLSPGDAVYLYTDGVTEAANEKKHLYGDQRLYDILNAHVNSGPEALLQAVKADVETFVGNAPQCDDITMLSLCYLGGKEKNKRIVFSPSTH